MKLPSLTALFDHATDTLRRFPLSLLSGFVAAFLLLQLIDFKFDDNIRYYYTNGLMICSIAVTLFMALSLWSEVKHHSTAFKYGIQAFAVLMLAWYYNVLPLSDYSLHEVLRFMLYNFCGHLLVAFLPYAGRYEPEGFWAYNKSLFLRFLTSVLYSGVLYAGLAIALLAIDNLFDVDIGDDNYWRLYIIIATVFNTWFFLSGVPSRFEELQSAPGYPKGLKIFTQYVLLPIITIYMLILYAYMVRIIISGEWPEGWVSWLVLCFSVAGILALLLIWPVRNDEGNTWMKIYAKGFYFALFPLVIMLFLSIRMRVMQYGITESRFFVVLLALWLSAIAAYFLFSRMKSIKVIPVSLFIIGILSIHGPWSAFSVSRSSQFTLLTEFLEQNGLMKDGRAIPATDEINREDLIEIREKIEYLNEVHGYHTLQELFTADLDSVMEPDSGAYRGRVDEENRILALLNLSPMDIYGDQDETYNPSFNFSMVRGQALPISGYDHYLEFELYNSRNKSERELSIGTQKLVTVWNQKEGTLIITKGEHSIKFDIAEKVKLVYNGKKGEYSRYNLPVSVMLLNGNLEELKLQLILMSVNGYFEVNNDFFRCEHSNLVLLVGS